MTYPNHIPLTPAEWRQAWWRKLPPLPMPEPVEFDWDDTIKRVDAVFSAKSYGFSWQRAKMSVSMSRREAHLWLVTILSSHTRNKPNYKDRNLFQGDITLDEVKGHLGSNAYYLWNAPQIMIPLGILFPMEDLLPVLLGSNSPIFANGWREYWLPYATDDELEAMRAIIRPALQNLIQTHTGNILSGYHYQVKSALFWGIYTACGDELLQIVNTLPDNQYEKISGRYNKFELSQIQALILNLPSSNDVVTHMKRLSVPITDAQHARLWLAHTEHIELEYLKDAILREKGVKRAKSLVNVLGFIKNAEVAGYMLELMALSKGADAARKWLDNEPELAIEGIVPLAKGQGQIPRAAVDYLRGLMRAGYEEQIAEQASDALLNRLSDRTVTIDLPEFDDETTPNWLAAFEIELKKLKGVHPPRWIEARELPPVVAGEYVLNEKQVVTLMMALKASKPDEPHAMINKIREAADRHLLDLWLWDLFERWRINGFRKIDLWVLHGMTLLGTDTILPKFGNIIKEWYTQKGVKKKVRQLAKLAVDNLAMQASDTAFLQLMQIKDVVRSTVQRNHIVKAMDILAANRDLSADMLHDKAVPDCGLDANGTTTFDYGRRTFTFVMGGDMSPRVRDETGKIRKNLPKAGKLDDAALAEPAYERWKFIKKQIRDTLKSQAKRLEIAMVFDRRWTVAEFEEIFLKHPLLQHIVKPLVWGIYRMEAIIGTFRYAEDGTLVDAYDEPIEIPSDARVGLAHPLHVDDDCRSLWREVLVDYELIPPFEQMNRAVFVLTKQQLSDNPTNLVDMFDERVQAVGGQQQMAKLGYESASTYYYDRYIRYFPNADISAYLEFELDDTKPDYHYFADRYVTSCVFVRGKYAYRRGDKMPEPLSLNDVHPTVISEMMFDLQNRIR